MRFGLGAGWLYHGTFRSVSQVQFERTAVTVKRSSACTCPPVTATMVKTGSLALAKDTEADHGEAMPPAATQQKVPRDAVDDGCLTMTRMFSSAPVMVPPTLSGDDPTDP